MTSTLPSANMNLPIPVVSEEPGPDYAADINNSLTIIDGHNHAPGSGVPVTPDGLNISSDLPFLNNNALSLRSVRFTTQAAPLALAADLGCLYESGVDLYYNDGNGNQIRITQSGSVAGATGTITGLPSGTASAAFSAGTFIFNASTNTGANIEGASFLLRNNSAGSHVLTLAPPLALGADYQVTLPSLPGVTNIMSMDTSGAMAASINVDNSTLQLTSNTLAVKDSGITTAKILDAAVTPAKMAALGQQVSSSTANFIGTSGSFTDITNATVTITVTGRPVRIEVMSDGSGTTSGITVNDVTGGTPASTFQLLRGATVVGTYTLSASLGAGGLFAFTVPSSSMSFFDAGATAGTYTYKLQGKVLSGNAFTFARAALVAYEIF